MGLVPSRELTYPIPRHFLKMSFLFHPLPNMGYVMDMLGYIYLHGSYRGTAFTSNQPSSGDNKPGLHNSQVPHPTKSLDFGPGGPAPILSCVYRRVLLGPFLMGKIKLMTTTTCYKCWLQQNEKNYRLNSFISDFEPTYCKYTYSGNGETIASTRLF